ncbi:hypothetical protein STENM223S_00285 [Streptomyces tendae]
MLGVLGEAETRVDDHAVGGDAALQDGLYARVKLVGDLGDHVVVHAPHVPALQEATPVHDDERGAGGGDDAGHGGVGEAAADVVDQGGPGRERLLGDGGAHGVDGDRDAFRDETADHRDDAPELLGLVDAGRAGAGGLAADVHQVGALGDQVEAVLDGRGGVEPASAVGEGVGGDVHDSHDRAAVPCGRPATSTAAALSAHTFSVGGAARVPPAVGRVAVVAVVCAGCRRRLCGWVGGAPAAACAGSVVGWVMPVAPCGWVGAPAAPVRVRWGAPSALGSVGGAGPGRGCPSSERESVGHRSGHRAVHARAAAGADTPYPSPPRRTRVPVAIARRPFPAVRGCGSPSPGGPSAVRGSAAAAVGGRHAAVAAGSRAAGRHGWAQRHPAAPGHASPRTRTHPGPPDDTGVAHHPGATLWPTGRRHPLRRPHPRRVPGPRRPAASLQQEHQGNTAGSRRPRRDLVGAGAPRRPPVSEETRQGRRHEALRLHRGEAHAGQVLAERRVHSPRSAAPTGAGTSR